MKKIVKYLEPEVCPFCGTKLRYHNSRGISTGDSHEYEWYLVSCSNCDIHFTEEYKLVFNNQFIGPMQDEQSIKDLIGKEIEVDSL